MENKDTKQSARVLTIWLIFIDIFIGVITNVATNVLPSLIKPYLWLSWPILVLLVISYLYFNWLSVADYSKKSDAQRGEWLAQKAIKQATPRVRINIVGIIRSAFVWLFSIPSKIDRELYRWSVMRKVSTMKRTIVEYSEAVEKVEELRDSGKLASDVANRAIAGLSADRQKVMNELLSKTERQLRI